jgi:DnaK suppressor protein
MSIRSGLEAELAEVLHAMRRLEEGGYGVCEACGRPIAADRLRARPAARFCVEDQARAERALRTA